MDADEKIRSILEEREKHYNLTLVLMSIVPWLVCLVCVAVILLGPLLAGFGKLK